MTIPLPHEQPINLKEEKILSPLYLDSHTWNCVVGGKCKIELQRSRRLSLLLPKAFTGAPMSLPSSPSLSDPELLTSLSATTLSTHSRRLSSLESWSSSARGSMPWMTPSRHPSAPGAPLISCNGPVDQE